MTHRRGLPLIVGGTALIACTYGLARYGYGLFLPSFRADFALSSTLSGLLATGAFGSYCAAALLSGHLVGTGRSRLAAAPRRRGGGRRVRRRRLPPPRSPRSAWPSSSPAPAPASPPPRSSRSWTARSRRPPARAPRPSSTPAPVRACCSPARWPSRWPGTGASPGSASQRSRSRPRWSRCGPPGRSVRNPPLGAPPAPPGPACARRCSRPCWPGPARPRCGPSAATSSSTPAT